MWSLDAKGNREPWRFVSFVVTQLAEISVENESLSGAKTDLEEWTHNNLGKKKG